MNIHIVAAILLPPHLIAIFFMALVIRKQYPLLNAQNDREVVSIRFILFFFAIILLLANIVPVMVDLLTLTDAVKRSTNVINSLGLVYTLANGAVALLSSVCFWLIYLLAERIVLNPNKE